MNHSTQLISPSPISSNHYGGVNSPSYFHGPLDNSLLTQPIFQNGEGRPQFIFQQGSTVEFNGDMGHIIHSPQPLAPPPYPQILNPGVKRRTATADTWTSPPQMDGKRPKTADDHGLLEGAQSVIQSDDAAGGAAPGEEG